MTPYADESFRGELVVRGPVIERLRHDRLVAAGAAPAGSPVSFRIVVAAILACRTRGRRIAAGVYSRIAAVLRLCGDRRARAR